MSFALRRDPTITLCWIIAVMGIVAAIYLFSPWIVIDTPGVANAVFSTAASTLGLYLLGVIFLGSSSSIIYGLVKEKIKWVKAGLLANLILRVYAFLIGFFTFGVTNTTIPSITVLLVVWVLYISVAKGDK